MLITDFTPEQQREIYESEQYDYQQHVGDYFGEDVVLMCLHMAHNNPKLQGFDMTLPRGSYRNSTFEHVRLCAPTSVAAAEQADLCLYWTTNMWRVHGYSFDFDAMMSHDSFKQRRVSLLTKMFGMTLPEAVVFMAVNCEYRTTFVVNERDVKATAETSYSEYLLGDSVDCRALIDRLIEDMTDDVDGTVCRIELTLDDSPFVAGVDPFNDLGLDEAEVTKLLHAAIEKITDVIHDFARDVDQAVEKEWEYRTGFEAWLEDATCNGIEFDPENYDIQIEETENV